MGSVGLVSTVKTTIASLKLFVNYHLSIGIQHIIIFSDDPNFESLDELAQRELVTVINCTNEYWVGLIGARPASIEERQIANVNYGARMLASMKMDWMIHVDCDELINPLRPINKILDASVADVVKFSLFEAVSEKVVYENLFEPTLFKRRSSKFMEFISKALGCTQPFYQEEYLRGHSASKTAVRLLEKFDGKHGIHAPRDLMGVIIVGSKLIQLLHYDCVGLVEWKRKWDGRIDGSSLALGMRPNRQRQMALYKEAKAKGECALVMLFNEMHNIVSWRDRLVLRALGMTKIIKLNSCLFQSHD